MVMLRQARGTHSYSGELKSGDQRSHKETTARDPTSFAVGNSQRNRKIFGPAQLSSVRQIGTELLTGTAQFDVAAAAILP